MKKTIFGIIAFALISVSAAPNASWAAMGSVQNFSYLETVSADKLGSQRAFTPDGKTDVGFSLSIRGTGAIRNISLKKTGTDEIWEASGGAGRPLLLVTDDNGGALNSPNGMPIYAFVLGARFNLWINDAAALLAKDSQFDAIVTFVDRSEAKASVKVPARKISSPPSSVAPAKPVQPATENKLVSADYAGQGDYDFVANEHKLQPNLNPDYRIDVRVEGSGIISAVKIKDPDNVDRAWDTVSNSSLPLVAVTDSSARILNRSDGSVAVSLGGKPHTLSLWIDGKEMDKSKRFTVTLLFSDGKVLALTTPPKGEPIPAPSAAPAQKQEEAKPSEDSTTEREVTLVAKPAPLKKGLVAKSENLKGTPGKNNISMLVKVLGSGTITSVELENRTGPGAWDTIQKNGRPIIMVREQTKVLNRANGSVTIPVKTKGEYELIVEDNGSLKKANARFLLTITWDDDTESQAVLNW